MSPGGDGESSGSAFASAGEPTPVVIQPPSQEQEQEQQGGMVAAAAAAVAPHQDELDLFGRELNPSERAYMREISSKTLQHVSQEPVMLRDEAEHLHAEIEGLAVRNYRTFVESSRCVAATHDSISTMDEQLSSLEKRLPSLNDACGEFVEQANRIKAQMRVNSGMIGQLETLQQLLGSPALMDSCVRNGLYEEALDLGDHIRAMAQRYPDVPVVQNIYREMEVTTKHLQEQLLSLLRGRIQLSACLRVVGFLRRLDVYGEEELRCEFLRSRNNWLDKLQRALPSAQADGSQASYEYLSKLLDDTRVHLFEIVTQYRAIFVDDTSAADTAEEAGGGDKGLLFLWVGHRTQTLLDTLERVIPQVEEGSQLASLLEQAMYCGQSLARVGVDFRPLLPALFEAPVTGLFRTQLCRGVIAFETALRRHDLHIPRRKLEQLGVPLEPHGELMQYPALATLANAFIDACNGLRHCAPLSARAELAKAAEETLLKAAQGLQTAKMESFASSPASTASNTPSSSARPSPSPSPAPSAGGQQQPPQDFEPVAVALVTHLAPLAQTLLRTVYASEDVRVDVGPAETFLKRVVLISPPPVAAPVPKPEAAAAVQQPLVEGAEEVVVISGEVNSGVGESGAVPVTPSKSVAKSETAAAAAAAIPTTPSGEAVGEHVQRVLREEQSLTQELSSTFESLPEEVVTSLNESYTQAS